MMMQSEGHAHAPAAAGLHNTEPAAIPQSSSKATVAHPTEVTPSSKATGKTASPHGSSAKQSVSGAR